MGNNLIPEGFELETLPEEVGAIPEGFEEEEPSLWGEIQPSEQPISAEEFGELQKRDVTATIPTTSVQVEEAKFKAIPGEGVTRPLSPETGREIAPGLYEQVAPVAPEIDAATKYMRGMLAQTRNPLTKARNAKRVFESQGYKVIDIIEGEEGAVTTPLTYVLEQDGQEFILDEASFESALYDIAGDPFSTFATIGSRGIGKAFGMGGLANVMDQALSKMITGEKLTFAERAEEVAKEAVLFGVGETIVQGISKLPELKTLPSKIKAIVGENFEKIKDRGTSKVLDELAKIPPDKRVETLQALKLADELDITLNPASVFEHKTIGQTVQIVSKNPFIRGKLEQQDTEGAMKLLRSINESIGASKTKLSDEEAGIIAKQAIKDFERETKEIVTEAYTVARESVTGDVFFDTVKSFKNEIDELIEFGKGTGIPDQYKNVGDHIKERLSTKLMTKGQLDANDLDIIRKEVTQLGKGAIEPQAQNLYKKLKDTLDKGVKSLTEFEGGETARLFEIARLTHGERAKIFGQKSKHPDIKRVFESEQPSTIVNTLLKGTNAKDNANLIRSFVDEDRRKILAQKYLDNALKDVDPKQSGQIVAALKNVDMEIVEKLAGKEATEAINTAKTLAQNIARSQKTFSGYGTPMETTGGQMTAFGFVVNVGQRLASMFLQERLIGKFLYNKKFQNLVKTQLEKVTEIQKAASKTGAERISRKANETLEEINKLLKEVPEAKVLQEAFGGIATAEQKEIAKAEAIKRAEETIIPEVKTSHEIATESMEALRKAKKGTEAQAGAEVGGGILTGAYAGIDQNEQGNITVDPEKFLLGAVAGMVGIKAGRTVARAYKTNPAIRRRVDNTLKKVGKESDEALSILGNQLKEKYPYLDVNPKIFAGQKARGFEEAERKFSDIYTKKVKFEISDTAMDWVDKKTPLSEQLKKGKTLGEIIKHDELFKNYPEMKDLKVSYNEDLEGAYILNGNIVVSKNYQDKETFLHEIQHAVQEKEGFARGGSPAEFMDTIRKELDKQIKANKITPEKAGKIINSSNPNKEYLKLLGEQEARDVSYRTGMSERTRKRVPPYQRLKDIEGELPEPTVKMRGGKAASERKFAGYSGQEQEHIIKFIEKSENLIPELKKITDIQTSSRKYKKPTKLYRGVATDGAIYNEGGTAEGVGLYTTTNKSLAKEYGTIREMNPELDLPKNPLVFNDTNQFEIWRQQIMAEVFGRKARASEYSAVSINEMMNRIGLDNDGIQVGHGSKAFWVKYPDIEDLRTGE